MDLTLHGSSLQTRFQSHSSSVTPVCFAAGTLIHTINGLVPIENIQVGDLVLAKPENGGEQSYKPVTQTFSHVSDKLVLFSAVGIEGPRSLDALFENPAHKYALSDAAGNLKSTGEVEWFLATASHRFFAKKNS